MPDQLTPYWDPIKQQFLMSSSSGLIGPASVDILQAAFRQRSVTLSGFQATGASATIPLGIAQNDGVIVGTNVAAITPMGSGDSYTVDIQKNGVTVLSSAIALLSSTAAYVSVPGTLASPPVYCKAGDFFAAVITYTHATGTAPANVSFEITLAEDPGRSVTIPMGIAPRAGTIQDARISAITPLTGNATFTADIRKNGTSILTGAMALLSSTAARASVTGTLTATNLAVAAGDFFEVVFTSTPGTGVPPQNAIAQVELFIN